MTRKLPATIDYCAFKCPYWTEDGGFSTCALTGELIGLDEETSDAFPEHCPLEKSETE